jgi:hypothetical protein
MNDSVERPEGFGGWLLMIAVGQWAGLFWTLGGLLLKLPGYAGRWSDPSWTRAIVGEAGIGIGLLAFMLYTTVIMSMKRREFPTLFRLQLALFVVAPLASSVWTSLAMGTTLQGMDFAATATQAVFGVAGASISILYSLRSERVRNTFVY